MKQIVLNIRNGEKNTDIAFPCVEEELGKALASIGLVNSPSPKAYVTEVVEPDALCLLESKVVDLDEVNYLAKLMDSEDETEKNTLFAVTACEGYDTPKELINLHFNLGCYTLVQPTDDAEAVGRRYMYSMKPCMTMTEAANTDFEKIGKDMLVLKKGIQTDYGTVFRNEEVEGQEIYDGQVFPCYHYTGEELLCIEAEYKDKKEYLYLPEEPMSITKALHRLGAEKPDDCIYQLEDLSSLPWNDLFKNILSENNIYRVNELALTVREKQINMAKLFKFVEYAVAESFDTILKLAEHINNFNYISEVGSYGELGKHVIQNYLLDDLPKRFEECIDYETRGEIFADEVKGKFLNGGFAYISEGKSLEDILSDADMRMGGIQ